MFVGTVKAVAAAETLDCHATLPPMRSRKYPKWGKRPAKPLGFRQTSSPFPHEKDKKSYLKINDQCGYVYENKGSAFHEPQPSGNVIENKGSYTSNTGMLLKRNKLAVTRELRSKPAPPPTKVPCPKQEEGLRIRDRKMRGAG